MSVKNLLPDFIHYQYQAGKTKGTFTAATLFIDIAGFTPLTETLAQYHRDGAEAITQIVSNTFTPHVEEVYRRGGFIPFYAGDAFIAIFPFESADTPFGNPNAAHHALQTAFAIQEYFGKDHKGRLVHTKYGDFEIGVKIGLGNGSIEWGIPGEKGNRAYYFRGEAIEACSTAQEAATTGEIIADATMMTIVGDVVTAVSHNHPTLSKLISCSATVEPTAKNIPQLTTTHLEPFVPDAILDMTVNAEFREVAPVFISFEEIAGTQQFHQFATNVIIQAKRYGGYFSQIDFGDKGGLFVILFGAPVAYENQVERAAEFLKALQVQNLSTRWRAGMTFGIVWAGFRGSQSREEYGTVGDMVNLAARLAMKADWGKIWVNETVNSRLRQQYWLGSLGEFAVKGKQKNVPIYQLFHKKVAEESSYYSGELIGRQHELEQLYTHVAPIFNGHSAGLIHIYGEAGIGKSRLVHEFRRRVIAKYYPSTFYCPAEEILRTSLNPFKNFLRSYFRQTLPHDQQHQQKEFDAVYDFLLQQIPLSHPDATEIKQELIRTRSILAAMVNLYWEGSLYEQLQPKLRFENTLAAFKNFVKASALTRPVILQIENGQWLDSDSHRMLASLTRNISNFPIGIICISRYEDSGEPIQIEVDADVEKNIIELTLFKHNEIQLLASQILKGTISDNAAQFLTIKSEGNPFYLEQLVLDMYEQGLLAEESGEHGRFFSLRETKLEDLPSNINTILLSRLDRLENEVKRVVRTATVLGQEFELNVLSYMMHGTPKVVENVKIAEQKQVWRARNELQYLFQSSLLRDAAYSMQLRQRLRELHKLAAEGIQQNVLGELSPHYADLAYHYDKADHSEEAVHWYKLSGERAADEYANDEAIKQFSRALQLVSTEEIEEQIHLLLAREQIYALQGARDEQTADLQALDALVKRLNNPKIQAELLLRHALHAEATGDYETAVSYAEQTSNFARTNQDSYHEAASALCWGRASTRLGTYEEAKIQLYQALKQANGQYEQIEADSRRNLGIINVDQGEYDAAKNYYELALQSYKQLQDSTGESTTLNNLGVLHWSQGEYLEAQRYYQEALKLNRHIGNRRGEMTVLINLGLLFMSYGDYANAFTYSQSALLIGQETGVLLGQCFAHLNMGLTHYEQDQFEQAHTASTQALQLATQMNALRFQGYAKMNLGHILLKQQEFVQSENAYQQALDIWQQMKLTNLVIEAKASLANVSFYQGEFIQAETYINTVLNYIDIGNDLSGTENLFQIYLICYRTLTAVDNPRASQLLTTAYTLLQKRASTISDRETRTSFLENVAVHRMISETYYKNN